MSACGGRVADEVAPSPPAATAPGPTSAGPRPAPTTAPARPKAVLPEWAPEASATATLRGSGCVSVPNELAPAQPRAHVIGIYQPAATTSSDQPSGAPAPVDVKVEATEPVVLVLSNRVATTWRVSLASGARVTRVLLNGSPSDGTTVGGLEPGTPVERLESGAYAYDWTYPESSPSAADFARFISVVRARVGGVEATFQGAYKATSFTVGSAFPNTPGAAAYDMGEACVPSCRAPGRLSWVWSRGVEPSRDFRSVTSSWVTERLRTEGGASCGKHYFELRLTAPARVGVDRSTRASWEPVGFVSRDTITVDAGAVVGVALDLDARFVRFVSTSPAKGHAPIPLDLQSGERVGAAVDTLGPGKVELVSPPFTFTPPPGYAADL